MTFKLQDLKKFLYSIKKYKVEHICIKSKNLQLTINTLKSGSRLIVNPNHISQINSDQANYSKDIHKDNIQTKANYDYEQDSYFTIVSPMIGTFYRSPAPQEAPFIEINDLVKINQTVCIIEAMKLMNEIESEVNGHIVEILVEDGDIVDCGQALMRVKHV